MKFMSVKSKVEVNVTELWVTKKSVMSIELAFLLMHVTLGSA